MAVTKQQLASENAVLRSRVSELEGMLQRERERKAAPTTVHKASPTPEQWRAAMNAAREEAMRTGRTVKVKF